MNPTSQPQSVDAIVIGGGISGLGVARAIAAGNQTVVVLESAQRLGGAVQTEMREGFLCEAGPNSMLVKSQAVWDFIEQIGLKDSRVEANAVANKRFLVKKGRLVALPQSPLGGITTPLYNPLEKLRLLAEPFISRSRLDDESVTSFVSRRMGRAFLEYGISALVSGIYAGDPDRLSLRHAFGKVWNLEQKYGSLIGGSLRLRRERRKAGITPFKSRMISFRDGLQTLIDTLPCHPSVEACTGVDLLSIRRVEGAWQVDSEIAGRLRQLRSRHLILATPLDAYSGLPASPEMEAALASIDVPEHPPLSTLVLGFDREQVEHPLDGFGVLFPRMEKRFCLGAIFSSTLFPGRAPDGKVALMCFIGGVQQPENGRLPTHQLVEATVRDLRPLLGLKGHPVFQAHTFWPRAIPQYNVGHNIFLEQLSAVEAALPGLHLLGNFRGGPGLNDCLESALGLAASLKSGPISA